VFGVAADVTAAAESPRPAFPRWQGAEQMGLEISRLDTRVAHQDD
jgi:hypothetical protein